MAKMNKNKIDFNKKFNNLSNKENYSNNSKIPNQYYFNPSFNDTAYLVIPCYFVNNNDINSKLYQTMRSNHNYQLSSSSIPQKIEKNNFPMTYRNLKSFYSVKTKDSTPKNTINLFNPYDNKITDDNDINTKKNTINEYKFNSLNKSSKNSIKTPKFKKSLFTQSNKGLKKRRNNISNDFQLPIYTYDFREKESQRVLTNQNLNKKKLNDLYSSNYEKNFNKKTPRISKTEGNDNQKKIKKNNSVSKGKSIKNFYNGKERTNKVPYNAIFRKGKNLMTKSNEGKISDKKNKKSKNSQYKISSRIVNEYFRDSSSNNSNKITLQSINDSKFMELACHLNFDEDSISEKFLNTNLLYNKKKKLKNYKYI